MTDSLFLMSFQELAFASRGHLYTGGGQGTAARSGEPENNGFSSVAIDSREAVAGSLFVALRGESLDGHRFVGDAFANGAVVALVDEKAMADSSLALAAVAEKTGAILVVVENTLRAFQDAAKAYLEKFPALLRIGITGSSGKTTTKEIAAAIIAQEKQVATNKGNLNSETGLPLSVFGVRAHHEVGVFEAAMSKAGEMADLARVLNPHIALITNIGSAHIGILGSRDAIAHEKKQLFCEFSGKNTAYIPSADAYRDFLAEGVRGKIVFYGAETLAALKGVRSLSIDGTEIDWGGEKTRLALPGKFNLANALAGVALALEAGASDDAVRRGISQVKPLFGRGEILKGKTTVIRDCYNSNPESAAAAVEFCDSVEWPGRKVYVLGSMLELGETSDASHAELGKQLSNCGADMVFLFGEEMRPAAEEDGAGMQKSGKKIPFFYTANMAELSQELGKFVQSGDLVLLKGSRGCALETVTDILIGEGAK
ncbi:MAG: UDP-N-acetylmuramoyl-tripeptide--D-alanyl-D-alanine ligase [Treponema sp.]|nr:UDP-N-acetylmuramoyl-tripeptide--D-alanyl-D-alanine ligase [Treponema sp.]